MSFFFYDLIFLIIVLIFLIGFLYKRRKKWKREGILILYKTKLGVKAINYISKKYKKFLNKSEGFVAFVGYILMASVIFFIFWLTYLFLKYPERIKEIGIPPLMPLIPYIPRIFKIDFLPPFYFTYWIVVLAIVAISHEFFHGIFAKARGIKIKSTGFAFLGPFIGAFVEPDENKVKKLKIKKQLGFLSAGTFANVLMAVLFFVVFWLFFVSAFTPSGVVYTYMYDIFLISNITMLNGVALENPSYEQVIKLVNETDETDIVGINNVVYDKGIVGFRKDNEGIYYIGVYQDAPALNAGLVGVIIESDGREIREYKDLKFVLDGKKPGDVVLIKTLIEESIKEYEIELIESPDDAEKGYLGIRLIDTEGSGLSSRLITNILFFKDPNTYYKPKFAEDLTVFIYNLIWWIILINISVALVNMLPLGIFDGGRVFFLTVLWITKSEKIAKKAYAFSTYLILFIFLLLMFWWFIHFYLL